MDDDKCTRGPYHVFGLLGGSCADRYPGIEALTNNVVICGGAGESYQGVQGATPEIALANAHLLAASWEMREALKAFLYWNDHMVGKDALVEAITLSRAALAKAAGQ